MVFNWVQYKPVRYDDYTYPLWGQGLGWALASLSLICIPLGMIKAFAEAPGFNFKQVIQLYSNNYVQLNFR